MLMSIVLNEAKLMWLVGMI